MGHSMTTDIPVPNWLLALACQEGRASSWPVPLSLFVAGHPPCQPQLLSQGWLPSPMGGYLPGVLLLLLPLGPVLLLLSGSQPCKGALSQSVISHLRWQEQGSAGASPTALPAAPGGCTLRQSGPYLVSRICWRMVLMYSKLSKQQMS